MKELEITLNSYLERCRAIFAECRSELTKIVPLRGYFDASRGRLYMEGDAGGCKKRAGNKVEMPSLNSLLDLERILLHVGAGQKG